MLYSRNGIALRAWKNINKKILTGSSWTGIWIQSKRNLWYLWLWEQDYPLWAKRDCFGPGPLQGFESWVWEKIWNWRDEHFWTDCTSSRLNKYAKLSEWKNQIFEHEIGLNGWQHKKNEWLDWQKRFETNCEGLWNKFGPGQFWLNRELAKKFVENLGHGQFFWKVWNRLPWMFTLRLKNLAKAK